MGLIFGNSKKKSTSFLTGPNKETSTSQVFKNMDFPLNSNEKHGGDQEHGNTLALPMKYRKILEELGYTVKMDDDDDDEVDY